MALKRWRRTPCGDSPKQKAGISVIARLSRKPGDESRSEIGTMRRVGPELEFVTRLNICVFLRLPNSCPPCCWTNLTGCATTTYKSLLSPPCKADADSLFYGCAVFIVAAWYTYFYCFCLFLPVFGSRPSDHYFRSVCLFVCLFVQSFSQPSLVGFRSNYRTYVICLGLVVSPRI